MHTIYLKTHNVTGLKYLGYTKRNDAHKYQGSGRRWSRHIRKHGYDVTTEILYQGDYWMVALVTAMEWNEKFDPKDNASFANLKDEELDGGWCFSKEIRLKMSESARGRKHSAETIEKLVKANVGKTLSAEHRAKISASRRGQKPSAETRDKMSTSHRKRERKPHSLETRRKISETKRKKKGELTAPLPICDAV